MTSLSIIEHDALREELAMVRANGYAHNLGESEPGVLSVSGPIRDITGRVRAAISVAGPQQRMEPMLDQDHPGRARDGSGGVETARMAVMTVSGRAPEPGSSGP